MHCLFSLLVLRMKEEPELWQSLSDSRDELTETLSLLWAPRRLTPAKSGFILATLSFSPSLNPECVVTLR